MLLLMSLHLNDSPIVKADSAVHLGHFIGVDSIRNNIGNGVSNLIRQTNVMLSKFSSCDCDVKSFLFKTYSASFYGSVLWPLFSKHIEKFYVTWRKVIRRVWNVPYRTHNYLLPYLLDDKPIHVQLFLRFSNFCLNAIHSKNSKVRICASMLYFSNSCVANNCRSLCHILNCNSISSMSRHKLKNCITDKQQVHNDHACQISYCIKELCNLRDGSLSCEFLTKNEICDFISLLCTS